MRYELETTGRFRKDLKLVIKRGYNMNLFQAVVDLLCAGEPLPEKHKDHALTGNWVNYQECHITPDWLLIYKIVTYFKTRPEGLNVRGLLSRFRPSGMDITIQFERTKPSRQGNYIPIRLKTRF